MSRRALTSRCLAGTLALVCVFGTIVATTSSAHARGRGGGHCAHAGAAARAAPLAVIRATVVCLINQQRRERGLPNLHVSWRLDRSAQTETNEMVARRLFAHGNFARRISAAGYDWRTAGENIAVGYRTARGVVTAWMASPDHCRNILDPSFANLGIGERPTHSGTWWTVDFGLSMFRAPTSHRWGPARGCPY